jgi:hypothetical protein
MDKFILKELKKALKKGEVINSFIKEGWIAKKPEYEWVKNENIKLPDGEVYIIYKKDQNDDCVLFVPVIS